MSKAYDMLSKYYDYLQKDVDYNNWIEIVKQYDTSISILEIGCGTGTLAKQLNELGYNIEAFDVSLQMIRKAKIKTSSINFFVEDITTFELNKKYDLIICFMDTINYIVDTKELKKSFKNVSNHLNQGAVFLFDVHKIQNINNFHGYLENGYVKNDEYRWLSVLEDPINNIVSHNFTFISKGKKIEEIHIQRIMTQDYYINLLNEYFDSISYNYDNYRVYYKCTKENDA